MTSPNLFLKAHGTLCWGHQNYSYVTYCNTGEQLIPLLIPRSYHRDSLKIHSTNVYGLGDGNTVRKTNWVWTSVELNSTREKREKHFCFLPPHMLEVETCAVKKGTAEKGRESACFWLLARVSLIRKLLLENWVKWGKDSRVGPSGAEWKVNVPALGRVDSGQENPSRGALGGKITWSWLRCSTPLTPGHSESPLLTVPAAIHCDNCSPTDCKPCPQHVGLLSWTLVSLSSSILNSFLRFNSISPSLSFLWTKSRKCCGLTSSFFKTFHCLFCCSSQKILINLPVIHRAAFSFSHNNSRGYLTS